MVHVACNYTRCKYNKDNECTKTVLLMEEVHVDESNKDIPVCLSAVFDSDKREAK